VIPKDVESLYHGKRFSNSFEGELHAIAGDWRKYSRKSSPRVGKYNWLPGTMNGTFCSMRLCVDSRQVDSGAPTAATRAVRTHPYYERVKTPILAALNGKTPRQALRTPTGRESVEALLAQFERDESRLDPNRDPSILASLRARLGLAS